MSERQQQQPLRPRRWRMMLYDFLCLCGQKRDLVLEGPQSELPNRTGLLVCPSCLLNFKVTGLAEDGTPVVEVVGRG
jgi:hypothetical protein